MFDINAKTGQWPYRPVGSLDDLLRTMDRYGIARAAISSLNSVHYFNPHDGNVALSNAVAAHRDRFVPVAVIRPNFAGWERDLLQCFEEFGMRGLTLYPNYHRFSLNDSETQELAALTEICSSKRVPVFVQLGIEDPRRQFRREMVEDVPAEAVGQFAGCHPGLNVVALGLKFSQAERIAMPWPKNLQFDTSNYERLGDLEYAVKTYGEERILFGTNAPLFHPRANVDKLQCADLTPGQRDAIARRNAAEVFPD